MIAARDLNLAQSDCIQKEGKPYKRPPNPLRLTPEEKKAQQDHSLKNPVPGTIREDGTIVQPKKWCDEDEAAASSSTIVRVPGPSRPLDDPSKGKSEPLIMTPNEIEKAAQEVDNAYDDYERSLPECPSVIKPNEVCKEKKEKQ